MKVELTGIELTTEKGTVTLTVAEAKELYRQLHELFREGVITVLPQPTIIERPVWWPVVPPYPLVTYAGDNTSAVNPFYQAADDHLPGPGVA